MHGKGTPSFVPRTTACDNCKSYSDNYTVRYIYYNNSPTQYTHARVNKAPKREFF